MHRWEKIGQVTGMSRVRIMTLNDAHIFCADAAQVEHEVEGVLRLMEEVYGVLGLEELHLPPLPAATPTTTRSTSTTRPCGRSAKRSCAAS